MYLDVLSLSLPVSSLSHHYPFLRLFYFLSMSIQYSIPVPPCPFRSLSFLFHSLSQFFFLCSFVPFPVPLGTFVSTAYVPLPWRTPDEEECLCKIWFSHLDDISVMAINLSLTWDRMYFLFQIKLRISWKNHLQQVLYYWK